MELREQMTPEGLERYLLLDGAVVSLEELRTMFTLSLSPTSMESLDPSRIRIRLQTSQLEPQSPILRVVHVRSAR